MLQLQCSQQHGGQTTLPVTHPYLHTQRAPASCGSAHQARAPLHDSEALDRHRCTYVPLHATQAPEALQQAIACVHGQPMQ